MKDLEERNAKRAEKSAEEQREEKLEEKRVKKREEEKERLEKISANSIEELIEKIKNKLYPEESSDDVVIEKTNTESKTEA